MWDVVDGVQRLSTILQFTGILKDTNGDACPPLVLVATDYLPGLDQVVWEDEDHPSRAFSGALRLDFKRAKLDLKIIK